MELHYILIWLIIIGIVTFQIKFYRYNKQRIGAFRAIFPDLGGGVYQILKEENSDVIKGIYSPHENKNFKEVVSAINNYLDKNRAAVSDFHLIKDIVERNCDIHEGEINTQTPMPLYLGLMGTMTGILIGVGFLVFNGGLSALLSTSSTVGGKGITELLGGVAIAMASSILGIYLTTRSSASMNSAKINIEKNKNDFFSWVQAELLPELSSDTSNTLRLLTRNLTNFNNTFSANTHELGLTLKEINSSYKNQAELMKAIERLKMQDVAAANINVLRELQQCTDELGVFNKYLHSVNDYLIKVDTLTESLNQHLDRTRLIEDMSKFFKDEIQQVEQRKGAISRSVGAIDDTLHKALISLQENTDAQFKTLTKSTVKQYNDFEKVIVQQQEILQQKVHETSAILSELKNLTSVKTSMANLEKATKDQNHKIDQLTSAIKELAQVKSSNNGSTFPLIPKWAKISVCSGLGLVAFTCLYFITVNVLSLFGIL
ncbi:MAG: hypothetical protein Q8909_01220 [Bacteroidota bacterium]|nr:hypothetical protein [Bacteroidota bacterium]